MIKEYTPLDFRKYLNEDGGFLVKGETFEGVTFTGPMVLAVSRDCTFKGGSADLFGSILEFGNSDMLCGAIIVKECIFIDCHFKHVQFGSTLTVKQNLIDYFINGHQKPTLKLVT